MVITIDGPAASGKSTIAQRLAKKLGFYFVSSGYLFRALSYLVLKTKKFSLEQLATLTKKEIDELVNPQRLAYCYDPNTGISVSFNGIAITDKLKDKTVDEGASIIGTNPDVRQALLEFQHALAEQHDLVLEGRDSGSVVFPNAQIKFFLTASLNERAKRYQKDQEQRGNSMTFDQALERIVERDVRDTTRAIAPLIVPHGAIGIDNTHLSTEQTLELMMEYIEKKREK